MAAGRELTQSELVQLFAYDATTGNLHWIVSRSNKVKAGSVVGSIKKSGYRHIGIGRAVYRAHRLVWIFHYGAVPSDKIIDHVNNDPSDNRIENLRLATMAQNKANSTKPSHNTSGFKGVSFDPKAKRWRARIVLQGRRFSIGRFKTPQEAHQAYCDAATRVYGEFARFA